jgi:hypothetical protein
MSDSPRSPKISSPPFAEKSNNEIKTNGITRPSRGSSTFDLMQRLQEDDMMDLLSSPTPLVIAENDKMLASPHARPILLTNSALNSDASICPRPPKASLNIEDVESNTASYVVIEEKEISKERSSPSSKELDPSVKNSFCYFNICEPSPEVVGGILGRDSSDNDWVSVSSPINCFA